jgi:ATP phosphoribosyltransferase
MNSPETFVADFIAICTSSGITSTKDICRHAKKMIESLEVEISKSEPLRTEQSKLRMVIRQLQGHSHKVLKRPGTVTNFIVNEKMCADICDFIEKNERATPRDIMDSVASIEENLSVYSAIKWLTERGVIKREKNGMVIVIGSNWDDRPGNSSGQS